MNLLLDFGNSRLKWALSDADCGRPGSRLVQRGVTDYTPAALAKLGGSLQKQSLRTLLFASVVSVEREQLVFAALQPPGLVPQRFTVSARVGNLSNAYASPETLGVDRWAAALGGWALTGSSCLIISTGTATTIDLVEAAADAKQATYRGGLILPGMTLMRQSLHTGTDRLPQAEGRYRRVPDIADNTHDAIRTGVIEATCGAIERFGRALPENAPWLLTGGAAAAIAEALSDRVTPVADLVLEGLASDLDLRQTTHVFA